MAEECSATFMQTFEETSYNPHGIRLIDETDSASTSDASTLIARPTPAYTGSPYVFERNPVALPGPLEELTPPPSPCRGSTPSRSPKKISDKPQNSPSFNFGPFLSHANAVLTPRSSANSSPTRQGRPDSPWSSTSSKGEASSAVCSEDNSSSPRRPKAFSHLFQFQGSSAPVSFGLVSTPSPKKEELPENSPFGPGSSDRPTSVPSKSSAGNASPTRPHNPRRGSTLSVAASFLGLSAPRAASSSPTRKSARPRSQTADEILELDFENEVFPNESLGGKGEKAFDELLTNAEKLFNKMRTAYARKCDAFECLDAERRTEREVLGETRERLEHVKQQLNEMSAKVEEREAEIQDLEDELEDRVKRGRTARMLSPEADRAPSQSSDRARKIWSADRSSGYYGCDEAGAESGAESVFDRRSRPSSSTSAGVRSVQPGSCAQENRTSTFWEEAAPFVPPEAAMLAENQDLKKRIGELEETLQSCLGIVDI
ncbi:MAG: hypothetical protein Q9159_006982 [Coniocarpon cinnabarinum]